MGSIPVHSNEWPNIAKEYNSEVDRKKKDKNRDGMRDIPFSKGYHRKKDKNLY